MGPGRPPLFAFSGVRVEGSGGAAMLDGLDAEVPDGGVTVVVGPSGAGKTTLLRLCNRLEVPTAGVVRFRGDDVAGLDVLRLRRRVGMVFQRPTPFGGSVRDNLHVAEPGAGDAACAGVLERAGLDATFLPRPAGELSGGEGQRMCVARALLAGPDVLLMDEPTGALDPAQRLGLERLATGLARDGVPVVWVTHDLDQMRRIADRVIVLQAGRAIACGAPDHVGREGAPAARAFLAGTGDG